ncbi:hypothetical protein [Paraherbaspirillum soli]
MREQFQMLKEIVEIRQIQLEKSRMGLMQMQATADQVIASVKQAEASLHERTELWSAALQRPVLSVIAVINTRGSLSAAKQDCIVLEQQMAQVNARLAQQRQQVGRAQGCLDAAETMAARYGRQLSKRQEANQLMDVEEMTGQRRQFDANS